MPRFLRSRNHNPPAKGVVDTSKGGTNAQTAEGAAESLQILTTAKKDAAGGYASLDENWKIRDNQIPEGINEYISLEGPLTSEPGAETTHYITNFDIKTPYVITAINGSIAHTGNVITYTAPVLPGLSGFTVNDREFSVAVSGDGVNQPSIEFPLNDAVKQFKDITFTSSGFASTGGEDIHARTSWELSARPDFSVIVRSAYNSSLYKTTWSVTGLSENTTYYARVKHIGTVFGESLWSRTTAVTTKNGFYPQKEISRLLPPVIASDINFGTAVGISGVGTTLISSAPYADNSEGISCGGVFIHSLLDGIWSEEGAVYPIDAADGQQFGYSISINDYGTVIAIGSPAFNNEAGAVYVFAKNGNTWAQQALLLASDAANGDRFGYSVTIASNGSTIAIGAPNNDNLKGTNSGAVYIFTANGITWRQQTKILGTIVSNDGGFGTTVALSNDGNILAAGSPKRTVNSALNRGAVSIFTRYNTVWSAGRDIIDINGVANDYFGNTLAVNGNGSLIIIGSSLTDTTRGINSGAAKVYLLTGDEWIFQAQLIPRGIKTNDQFAASLAINYEGTVAIFGAPRTTDVSRTNAGVYYIFTRDGYTWTEKTCIKSSDDYAEAQFGNAVAITADGNTAAVGAFMNNSMFTQKSGAVFIYN